MNKANRNIKLADWQLNPDALNTSTGKIQVWSRSGTMIGVRDIELGRELVKNGTHFVMCSQAIGEI